jgi:hypothetical protein
MTGLDFLCNIPFLQSDATQDIEAMRFLALSGSLSKEFSFAKKIFLSEGTQFAIPCPLDGWMRSYA